MYRTTTAAIAKAHVVVQSDIVWEANNDAADLQLEIGLNNIGVSF